MRTTKKAELTPTMYTPQAKQLLENLGWTILNYRMSAGLDFTEDTKRNESGLCLSGIYIS